MIKISILLPTVSALRVSAYRPECSCSACERSAATAPIVLYSAELAVELGVEQEDVASILYYLLQARARGGESVSEEIEGVGGPNLG